MRREVLSILKIIDKNNEVIREVEKYGDVKIDPSLRWALMEINHAFTCESASIVKLARELGIDAKYNAQSGLITVYNQKGE